MTVATFVQPVFTSQDAATYKAAIDASVNVVGKTAGAFAPHEAATPAMSVVVDGGAIQDDVILVTKTAQTVVITAADATNPRIDRVVLDSAGVASAVAGTAAPSPSVPAIPSGKTALCQIAVGAAVTTILNSNITDERIVRRVQQRIVTLDTPEVLDTSTTINTWTSSSTFASTTLPDAKAVAAEIKLIPRDTATTDIGGYLRKAGSSLAVGFASQVCGSEGASSTRTAVGQSFVSLDSNSDFEFRYSNANGTALFQGNVILMSYIIEE